MRSAFFCARDLVLVDLDVASDQLLRRVRIRVGLDAERIHASGLAAIIHIYRVAFGMFACGIEHIGHSRKPGLLASGRGWTGLAGTADEQAIDISRLDANAGV